MSSFNHTKMRYTVKEACRILSVGTTRIYELFNRGLLKHVMDGRRRYVPAQALDDYMHRIDPKIAKGQTNPDKPR